MLQGLGTRCVAIAITATACGALAPASAQALTVRISAPATSDAGKPCRVVVTVPGAMQATAVLQERKGRSWRSVAKARLRRRVITLRCPPSTRAGSTRRFRVLVRSGGQTIGRSAVVSTRIVALSPPTLLTQASSPPDAPPIPPTTPNPAPAPPAPLDPAQFGVEGTGGAPSAQTLALLANSNVIFNAVGVADLQAGRIDPRIVAVLAKLADGHVITVGAMCSDLPKFTTGGSISNNYLGRGVEIVAIDGVAIGPSHLVARELTGGLASLHPTYRPDEIGSPWPINGPGYFTDAAHQDHVHVAFESPIDPFWTPPPG